MQLRYQGSRVRHDAGPDRVDVLRLLKVGGDHARGDAALLEGAHLGRQREDGET